MPIPNFLSEVILDISDFSMLLTRLRPSKGSAVFNRSAHSARPSLAFRSELVVPQLRFGSCGAGGAGERIGAGAWSM